MRCLDDPDDLGHLEGHAAAVGVAQDDAVDIGLGRRLQRLESVVRVGLVAVEEVLGVVDHLADMLFQVGQRVVDQLEVLLEADAQRLANMEVPGLAEDGDGVRLGLHQGADVAVLVRGDLGPPGRAEGRDLGMAELDFADILEEGDVLGIGAGPAALDVVDAEFVEFLGDADLVGHQEGDVLGLGAVAQGGVVQPDSAHAILPLRIVISPWPGRRLRAARARPVRCTCRR